MCGGLKMTREEIYVKLTEIFQEVFDDESIVVNNHTTAADIEEWDSLEHINLIMAVEAEFAIKFKMGEVSAMKNVGEMVHIILKRLSDK
jgi:Acyl carrier protein